MGTPAPFSWPSSASRARLPPEAASGDREGEHAIGAAAPARPSAVGDTIVEPLGAPTADAEKAGAEHRTTSSTPGLHVELALVHPPADLTQRVRLLPANTLLHIPTSSRLRIIAATAQCWQGMARGSDDFSLLEEGTLEAPAGLGTPRVWRRS